MTTPNDPKIIKGLAQTIADETEDSYRQVMKWVNDWRAVQDALIWLESNHSSIASEKDITAVDQVVNSIGQKLVEMQPELSTYLRQIQKASEE